MPECISKAAGHIRVNGHLQICDHAGHVSNPSVFALGDVADTGGPRMARASMFQGDVVVQNVLALVKGNKPRARYHPNWALEGNIKLTLGVVSLFRTTRPIVSVLMLRSIILPYTRRPAMAEKCSLQVNAGPKI